MHPCPEILMNLVSASGQPRLPIADYEVHLAGCV
jgi:hypothetical protein